jgi:hypothetical protein
VHRRIHVKPDDVLNLLGKIWIAGALEGAQAMRLQVMGIPDALHRARLTPAAFAMARPVQCVTCPGGLEQVSAKIFATVAVVSFAVPGGRVLSRSKAATPASAYRVCQRHTAGRLTPAWRATSATANPSPDSNTIRARWMCFCGRFRSIAIADNCF